MGAEQQAGVSEWDRSVKLSERRCMSSFCTFHNKKMLNVPFRRNGLRLSFLAFLMCSVTGQTTLNSFTMSQQDRVAGKTVAAATFTFTPSAGGALGVAGMITMNYPSGFFVSGTTLISAVAQHATFNSVTPGQTSITLTVTTGVIAASSPITVTLSGFTMGTATAGGNVTVQTSVDVIKSGVQASGFIGGFVSFSNFGIDDLNRDAIKSNVSVSFSFAPSAGGLLSDVGKSQITLVYPRGFFSFGVTPSVILNGATAISNASGMSSIVITLQSGLIAANVNVVVTLTGMTMGADGTPGDSVNCTTTRDPIPSASQPSGILRCSSPPGKCCPEQLAANQDCPEHYYCPSATMKKGILCPKGAYCKRGKSMYQNCPAGSFNPNNGSSQLVDCIFCQRGYYCGPDPGQSEQTPCYPGTFNNYTSESSKDACKRCEPGRYCPEGSSFQTDCPAGTFGPVMGQSSPDTCLLCEDNYYSSSGSSMCTECDGGGIVRFTKLGELATSQYDCILVGWRNALSLDNVILFCSLVCFFVLLCFYCLYLDRKHPGSSHLPIFFAFMSLTEIAGLCWVLSETWRIVRDLNFLLWRYPGIQAVVVGLSSIYGISYLHNFLKSLSWAKKVRHALQAHEPSCPVPILLRRKSSAILILNAGMNALRDCGYYSSCAWRALRTFCSAAATLAVGFSSRPLWTPRFRTS
jgi:hypothetical protein